MDIGGSVREDEREEKKTGKKEERKRCEGERKNNFYKANKKKEIKSWKIKEEGKELSSPY